MRFHYNYIYNIGRPPKNGVFRFQLHYRVYDVSDASFLGRFEHSHQWLGFGSALKLWVHPVGFTKAADYYSAALHEIAHAAHWESNQDNWSELRKKENLIVIESWAIGVQHFLTQLTYRDYDLSSYTKEYPNYTGIVIDLHDSEDGKTFDGTNFSEDRVARYSLVEQERGLTGAKTWPEWETNLRSRVSHSTEQNLPRLFEYWE